MEAPVTPAPEKKESRTGPVIGAVAAIVLCGLTGLCLLCPLSIYIFTGTMPDYITSSGNNMTQWWGILPLCVSIVFIAIGVVVPIVLLRKKKPAAEAVDASGEPLPPAS